MNEKELISILENYAVFVDDDFGGSYQSIISYTKDKEISKAFTSLGALQIIDEFKQLQQENQQLKEKLSKAKEFVNKNMVIHSNAFGVVWCDIDEKGKEELLDILDTEKSDK